MMTETTSIHANEGLATLGSNGPTLLTAEEIAAVAGGLTGETEFTVGYWTAGVGATVIGSLLIVGGAGVAATGVGAFVGGAMIGFGSVWIIDGVANMSNAKKSN